MILLVNQERRNLKTLLQAVVSCEQLLKGYSNAHGTQAALLLPKARPLSWDAFRPGGKELKDNARPQNFYVPF